jgi:hypothetical protein
MTKCKTVAKLSYDLQGRGGSTMHTAALHQLLSLGRKLLKYSTF